MNPRRREALILGAAGIAATAAGFLVGPLLLQLGGKSRSAIASASFPDLTGRVRSLSEWNDRILVCNFWATWCGPCREEIPLLIEIRGKMRSLGVEVVGIAIDNAAKVQQYAANFSIPYPVLLAEGDGLDLMRRLGNSSGGLPYTVVVARSGDIVATKLGAYKPGELDQVLRPLTSA